MEKEKIHLTTKGIPAFCGGRFVYGAEKVQFKEIETFLSKQLFYYSLFIFTSLFEENSPLIKALPKKDWTKVKVGKAYWVYFLRPYKYRSYYNG